MKKTELTLGILLAVIGLMMLIAPGQCIKVTVILLGVEAVANGAFTLVKVRPLVEDPAFQYTVLARSLVSVVVGILAIVLPLALASAVWSVMLYTLAVYLLVSAALELYAVAKMRGSDIERKSYITEIIVSVAVAIVLFIMPQKIGEIVIRLLGLAVLLISAGYMCYHWKNRSIVIDNVEVVDDVPSGE